MPYSILYKLLYSDLCKLSPIFAQYYIPIYTEYHIRNYTEYHNLIFTEYHITFLNRISYSNYYRTA